MRISLLADENEAIALEALQVCFGNLLFHSFFPVSLLLCTAIQNLAKTMLFMLLRSQKQVRYMLNKRKKKSRFQKSECLFYTIRAPKLLPKSLNLLELGFIHASLLKSLNLLEFMINSSTWLFKYAYYFVSADEVGFAIALYSKVTCVLKF